MRSWVCHPSSQLPPAVQAQLLTLSTLADGTRAQGGQELALTRCPIKHGAFALWGTEEEGIRVHSLLSTLPRPGSWLSHVKVSIPRAAGVVRAHQGCSSHTGPRWPAVPALPPPPEWLQSPRTPGPWGPGARQIRVIRLFPGPPGYQPHLLGPFLHGCH